MDLKKAENLLYIIGNTYAELGGSEYYRLHEKLGKSVPKLRLTQARKAYHTLSKTIGKGLIEACHDLSEGGLAVAASEMVLASGLGAEIDLRKVPSKQIERNDLLLFSESNSRFLIEVDPRHKGAFEAMFRGKSFAEIGRVTKNQQLTIQGRSGSKVVDVSGSDLRIAWKRTLSAEET
jgi:phosphoribosylformylglycinamidine synthase